MDLLSAIFSIHQIRITSGGGDPPHTSGVQFWRYPLPPLLTIVSPPPEKKNFFFGGGSISLLLRISYGKFIKDFLDKFTMGNPS